MRVHRALWWYYVLFDLRERITLGRNGRNGCLAAMENLSQATFTSEFWDVPHVFLFPKLLILLGLSLVNWRMRTLVMFMRLRKKAHPKFHNHCLSVKENWVTPNSGISCKATEQYQTFFKVILFLVIG